MEARHIGALVLVHSKSYTRSQMHYLRQAYSTVLAGGGSVQAGKLEV